MASITLDSSKKVFSSPNCLEDQKRVDYILKVLMDYKIPRKNIIKGIDMDILNSGDYLVRCIGNMTQVFETELLVPFGFVTKLLGNL